MEGTLSARPEGVVVPAQGGHLRGSASSGSNKAPVHVSQFLDSNKLALHLGAAALALVAAAAHAIEQVPVAVAPVSAAIAAILVILIASLNRSVSMPLASAPTDEPDQVRHLRPAGEQPLPGLPVRPAALRATQAHANLAAELAQAAALAQLTARISHDLRTPLNAVIGFSELMSKEAFGPLGSQRYQDYARHIRECGETLLKSTEDTLAITSSLAQPMGDVSAAWGRPVPLGGLVNEAWECVALNAARESMSLSCQLPDALEMFGDRRVIRQILVNVFQDAVSRGCWHACVKVSAVLDGQGIRLTIKTQGRPERGDEETLPLCVARTLAELHALPVTAGYVEQDLWVVSLGLERALQPDFFFETRTHIAA